ncbi:MAG: hypothetical protein JWQ90_3485 [Hydrocarboniphaga sp.]|uniref:hypothetical protein n=1 Tax=Hydrocarboniphaga sp. TaxID=2033016 RepID=UPI002609B509|nr:hypothetical protein [Hydrocarboniphaga sp.]MDB5971035.1 hypothetical protein [Hydrocarboniphaga sp.]
MNTQTGLGSADGSVEATMPLRDWAARRSCHDCGPLVGALATPVLPATLEPAVYLLDDAMLQGPHRLIQTFVCQSCGRCWHFDGLSSAWGCLD